MISTSKIVQQRTISRPRIRSGARRSRSSAWQRLRGVGRRTGAVARAAPVPTPCAAVPDGVTLVVGNGVRYAVARASGAEHYAVALGGTGDEGGAHR